MLKRTLTNDYIRGLIENNGSFIFSKNRRSANKIVKIPSFQLKMHVRNRALIKGVRDHLELNNKIYTYHHPGKDGYNRDPYVMLIVRDFGSLKNIIIPFFYNKLAGNKGLQFVEWLDKIGIDPMVPESYKLLYKLHENGFYSENPKFIE